MKREDVFAAIESERKFQDEKWGTSFDDNNTVNDWASYICIYLGRAVAMPWDADRFKKEMLKVATIAVAILEREQYQKRHYDK